MTLVELICKSNSKDISDIFKQLFYDCDWVIETAHQHLGLESLPEEPKNGTIEYYLLNWLNTGFHKYYIKVYKYAYENNLVDSLFRGIILDSADYGDYEISYYFSDKLTPEQLIIMKEMFRIVNNHEK